MCCCGNPGVLRVCCPHCLLDVPLVSIGTDLRWQFAGHSICFHGDGPALAICRVIPWFSWQQTCSSNLQSSILVPVILPLLFGIPGCPGEQRHCHRSQYASKPGGGGGGGAVWIWVAGQSSGMDL